SGEPAITASLTTKTVDLDALLAPATPQAAAPATGGPAAPPVPPGRPAAGDEAIAFALPTGLSATVELAADALVYRGQPLRQLQVAARLENGRLDVSDVSVLLPGSSDLQLTGSVSS